MQIRHAGLLVVPWPVRRQSSVTEMCARAGWSPRFSTTSRMRLLPISLMYSRPTSLPHPRGRPSDPLFDHEPRSRETADDLACGTADQARRLTPFELIFFVSAIPR